MTENKPSTEHYTSTRSTASPVSPPSFEVDNIEEEIDLSHFWGIFVRNKWGILGIALLCSLIGAFSAYSMRPMYQAEVSILIEPNLPKAVSIDSVSNTSNIWLFFETQRGIIRSRSVAEVAAKKLKLDENPLFASEDREDTRFLTKLKGLIPKEWSPSTEQSAPSEDVEVDFVSFLQSGLTVTGEEESQIVVIKYMATEPQLAADIANAIAESYIEVGLESHLAMTKQAVSWLTERLDELRTKLEGSEEDLKLFQAREGVVDSESQQDIFRRKLGSITEKLVTSQAELVDAEIRYRQVQKAERDGGNFDSLRSVLRNNLVQKLKEEEARLGRRVAELDQRYGEKHPKLIHALSDLKEAKQQLKLEVLKVVEGIRKEYDVALENEQRLTGLSERIKTEIRGVKGKEFDLAKLEREVSANRHLYDTFLTRLKETDISGELSITNIRIIDRAKPPAGPLMPSKRRIIGIWLLGGLCFGFLLAFLREHLDQTFKTNEDIERELQIPALGSVPMIQPETLAEYLYGRELLTKGRELFPETIRNIRTGLILSDPDNPPKTILVTSSVPNEGKTSLSCELALSFSQLGRTLLLDADLRKPSLAKVMGLRQLPGLTDMVAEKTPIKDALQRDSNHNNLFFVTSGSTTPKAMETLSSRKFADMFLVLKGAFDYIVIDAAPVLLFSDALVLSRLCDCTIMVIKANQTPFTTANETIKRFRASNANLLGAILSHQIAHESSNGYGGYSYYGDYGCRKSQLSGSMIDIHSHILPGVDDGSPDYDTSFELLRLAEADSIDTIVLTPHIDPLHYPNSVASLKEVFSQFKAAALEKGFGINLRLGAEVMIGPELLQLVDTGEMLWLGSWEGKKVFLLEFPQNSIPAGSVKLVERLVKSGVLPMIVHPERNREVQLNLKKLKPFREAGCLFQVTAKSLEGGFGRDTYKTACELVRCGWTSAIASDCHNVQYRPPGLSGAVRVASKIIGQKAAKEMVERFPRSLLGLGATSKAIEP